MNTITLSKKKQPITSGLTEITDYEEKIKECSKYYHPGVDSSIYLGKSRFFILTKGEVLRIEEQHPKIQSNLYYDDTETPGILTEVGFINYNLIFFHDYDFNENLHLTLQKGAYYIETYRSKYAYTESSRVLTFEEKAELKQLFDEQRQKYIKRLKSYWAKYNSKISQIGCWANR